jgi:hypothetical protein
MEVEPMELAKAVAIEQAIRVLAEKITTDVKSEDALRFSQAALNMQHIIAIAINIAINDHIADPGKVIEEK